MITNKCDFCTTCRKVTQYSLHKQKITKTIKDKNCEFEYMVAICDECGKEMDVPGLLDMNADLIDKQYRTYENLVSKDDIQKLMDIYNMGKSTLSLALGFGEITITRYMNGQIPSKEYSDVIKNVLESPKLMKNLINENRDKIGEVAYKKAIQAADKTLNTFTISEKMIQAISYYFKEMREITPLALQKLLYFSQGIYLSLYGKAFYKEDCMAWIHGPVYESVYDLFKDFKYSPIDDDRFAILKDRHMNLNDDERTVLDLVINSFGKYGGKILEKITHEETPWKKARVGFEVLEKSREIIKKEDIKEYFDSVSKKYGLDTKEKLDNYIKNIIEISEF